MKVSLKSNARDWSRLLQILSLLLLLAMAWRMQAFPTLITWLVMVGIVGVLIAAAQVGKGRRKERQQVFGLVATTLLLLALAYAGSRSFLAEQSLQWGWLALVGLPTAFLSVTLLSDQPRSPWLDGAWLTSVGLGVWLLAPWRDGVGALLLLAFAWIWFCTSFLQSLQKVQGMRARASTVTVAAAGSGALVFASQRSSPCWRSWQRCQ